MADDDQSKPIDPGDSPGAGSPGWPVIGEMRMIDGRPIVWVGVMWLPAKMVA